MSTRYIVSLLLIIASIPMVAQLQRTKQSPPRGLVEMTSGTTSVGARFALITTPPSSADKGTCILARLLDLTRLSVKDVGYVDVSDRDAVVVSAGGQTWIFHTGPRRTSDKGKLDISVDALFTCSIQPGNTHDGIAARLFAQGH